MTQLDALKELAANVEAGTCPLVLLNKVGWGQGNIQCAIDARRAFHGDLNAAKALYKAVLPGWRLIGLEDKGDYWRVTLYPGDPDVPPRGYAHASCPARAWLLAIIRALIAQEEAKAPCDPL